MPTQIDAPTVSPYRRLPVLSPIDNHVVYRGSRDEIRRLIEKEQADFTPDRRAVVLRDRGEEWPCRTHTSRRNRDKANMGMSQLYTTADDRGRVDGFKKLFDEDRPIFQAAILDNLRIEFDRALPVVDGCMRITSVTIRNYHSVIYLNKGATVIVSRNDTGKSGVLLKLHGQPKTK